MKYRKLTSSKSSWSIAELSRLAVASVFMLLACLALSGCKHGVPSEVYYNVSNWYVRQNAIPRYAVQFDVFYMHPEAFDADQVSIANIEYTKQCTTEMFGRKARIFAPVCHNVYDCKAAYKWFIKHYHGNSERPLVFIGEGEGAKMLEQLVDDAKDDGLVATRFKFEDNDEVLITPELVDELCEKVRYYLYELSWRKKRHAE